MIAIDIPGRRELRLNHLVLDYNDTVAVDDKLLAGLLHATALAESIRIDVVTADTFGRCRPAHRASRGLRRRSQR